MKSISFLICKLFFLSILIVISFSFYLIPQNQPQVSLTADRVDIQQWERISFKATLNYDDPRPSYIFYINNEQNTIGVFNNELRDYEFQETGSFIIKVLVRSRNNLLTDSLRINVRKVGLSINPQEIFAGEKVSFKLGYQLPENYVKYRFHYGDNSQSDWLSESISTHVYERTGNYTVYCEIGKFDGDTPYDLIQSEVKQVKVNIKPTYEVSLSAITYSHVDEIITFTANSITNVPNSNFRYQFDFGDNTDTAPQAQKIVEHSYKKPGTYKSIVKLFSRKNELLAESNVVTIIVQELDIRPQSISFIVHPIEVKTDEEVNFKLELQNGYKNFRYRLDRKSVV